MSGWIHDNLSEWSKLVGSVDVWRWGLSWHMRLHMPFFMWLMVRMAISSKSEVSTPKGFLARFGRLRKHVRNQTSDHRLPPAGVRMNHDRLLDMPKRLLNNPDAWSEFSTNIYRIIGSRTKIPMYFYCAIICHNGINLCLKNRCIWGRSNDIWPPID
jgi:hypothetical protein